MERADFGLHHGLDAICGLNHQLSCAAGRDVVGASLFRVPLTHQLQNLKSVRWKDFQAEFAQTLESTYERVQQLPSDEAHETAPAGDDLPKTATGEWPSTVVTRAWSNLHSALGALGEKCGWEFALVMPPSHLAEPLAREGVLEKEVADLVPDLERLQNLSLRLGAASAITSRQANQYQYAANEVAERLKRSLSLIRHGEGQERRRVRKTQAD